MNRYDFVYLFECVDANPNGDPDAGNLPRVDTETGHGLVTDVCLKRKVRNFVELTKGATPPYDIYVKEKAVLEETHKKAYQALKIDPEGKAGKRSGTGDEVAEARKWMCQNFFDIRTFGAVMSLKVNCGQVRGPVQLSFARSIDPIVTSEHSITRMAVATAKEAENQGGDNRTMGRKFTVPYGLYRGHGFINPFLAAQTGFADSDRELLFAALINAFQFDQSAARPAGSMAARALIVFEHDSQLGKAPSHALFDAVTVTRNEGVETARKFADYTVAIDAAKIPAGITVHQLI